MAEPAPAPHPNHRRPAALPSAWGNFLWGPEETAFVCLMSVKKAEKQFAGTLSSIQGSSDVPSDKLRLAPAPHRHQFPRPHMLSETGHPQPLGQGRGYSLTRLEN